MIEPLLILAFSVVILAKSSDIAIESSINIARFFRISEMAIGFILLSVATSMPELVVSVIAALENQVGISVGNVLGSNIANICLVLGVSLLIGTIKVKKKEMRELVKILLITSILPLIMLLDYMRDFMGVILLLLFLAYIYFILKKEVTVDNAETVKPRKAVESALVFSFSILLVIVSAKYAVESAVEIATILGISKAFIGATVIAVGTSLPELAVNVMAMRKNRVSLALGNVLGSCITNLTLILGLSAVLNPLAANLFAFLNLIVFMLISNLTLWYFLQSKKLTRNEGLILVGIYLVFLMSSTLVELRT